MTSLCAHAYIVHPNKRGCVISTNDVPGAVAAHNDTLAALCWAEHADGTLIFVESTENFRVIFLVFDMAKSPIIEFRDAMPESDFKKKFSFNPKASDISKIKWTWHDKTPFPWDKVIDLGSKSGSRFVSADDTINEANKIIESRNNIVGETAADIVARDLSLQGRALQEKDLEAIINKRVGKSLKKFSKGIADLVRKNFGE